ncbi:MAG TPA: adenylate/guanylate cyclase domain-containing protein, partial [Saprospiraceae bacterium]|nr:adenylate/guanylate cyclase domain-containing protein [Saprospiraceae bacterium]
CIAFSNIMEIWRLAPILNYILLSVVNVILFRQTKNFKLLTTIQLLLILISPIATQIVQGGFSQSGGVAIASIFAPIGALLFLSIKRSRFIFYICMAMLVLGTAIEFFYLPEEIVIDPNISLILFLFVYLSIIVIVYFVFESFVQKNNVYQIQLAKEKERSESLLLNILPHSIALELKESGWSKAKGYASATVVFTDFVKFSGSTKFLTPGKLVEQLDVYFRAFDDIVEKHGVEKIKTIGDAYLFASGIPEENHNHASVAIKAALDMQKAIVEIQNQTDISHPYEMRLGIHSGPLVAGVVGKKKFAYDIWGDTVNVAARIEQNGIPGEVVISKATYELTKHRFKSVSEGMVEGKNVGQFEIFRVVKKMEL